MESIDSFKLNIRNIHLLNSIIDNGSKKLLLSVIVTDEYPSEIQCVMKILEKEKIWIKTLNFEQFVDYKTKMGFDGSWESFFKTFILAINKAEGGGISLKYPNSIKDNLILTVHHPLSDDIKVRSDITIDTCYLIGSEQFRNYNFDLMLEIYESKNFNHKKLNDFKDLKKHEMDFNKSITFKDNSGGAKIDLKKNVKRKYNSDLINPNVRRRAEKGVKFVKEDNENELYDKKSDLKK